MNFLISIVGPTAVGKTAFGIRLANMFRSEVVSADSRQVYKELNIGTAKPLQEEMDGVVHHFVDRVEPTEEYNAGRFAREVDGVLTEIFSRQFLVVMVGGSGLYLQSVWEGFDDIPATVQEVREAVQADLDKNGLPFLLKELKEVDAVTYDRIDRNNPRRVMRAVEVYRSSGKPLSEYQKGQSEIIQNCKHIKVGLTMDRDRLYDRINLRVNQMVEAGLVEEAKALFDKYGDGVNALQTVGYREFLPYFKGEYDLDRAIDLVKRNTRRFAKRQYTWFRRFDDIAWFEHDEVSDAEQYVLGKIGVE